MEKVRRFCTQSDRFLPNTFLKFYMTIVVPTRIQGKLWTSWVSTTTRSPICCYFARCAWWCHDGAPISVLPVSRDNSSFLGPPFWQNFSFAGVALHELTLDPKIRCGERSVYRTLV
ncbi:unnamed protein product [Nippostrongylus brasiliensis]|uniref:Uncharacterized protein n=1 Tax=Nippostrongylus brasiliensis TaxID=27835 RepID=A0A0N4XSJ7_NIPBR|nr:unnamed protein product [Nippostrongylus brasiliensis]